MYKELLHDLMVSPNEGYHISSEEATRLEQASATVWGWWRNMPEMDRGRMRRGTCAAEVLFEPYAGTLRQALESFDAERVALLAWILSNVREDEPNEPFASLAAHGPMGDRRFANFITNDPDDFASLQRAHKEFLTIAKGHASVAGYAVYCLVAEPWHDLVRKILAMRYYKEAPSERV